MSASPYPDGEWELEIHMPEDRMSHVAQGSADRQKMGENLPVLFYLSGKKCGSAEYEGEPARKFTLTPRSGPRKETPCWCGWRSTSRSLTRPT